MATLGKSAIIAKKIKKYIDEGRDFWKRFSKGKTAVVGFAILVLIIIIAVAAPFVAPYDPFRFVGTPLQAPSASHLMGTDDLGRDGFSGFLWGARVSLLVGFLAAALSVVVGVIVGGLAGFYGGVVDAVLMRISEGFQMFPPFFLAMLLLAIFGSNILNVILVIGILSWPSTARLVRGETLSLKEQQFVEASRSLGAHDWSILFFEILPNAAGSIIVNTSTQAAWAITYEAGFGFLGLVNPQIISWGSLLNDARSFMMLAWWMAFFPGLGISLVTLALNLVGDGLNDALKPRLKEM